MFSKMRLAIITSDMYSGCSFYRGMGPVASLHNWFEHLELNAPSTCGWLSLKFNDLVFVPRPQYENDQIKSLSTCKIIKANHKPLIIDFDDNLFDIPDRNPVLLQFPDPPEETRRKIIDTVLASCELSDAIMVTNGPLKQKFKENGVPENKLWIVPNAADDSFFPKSLKKPMPQNNAERKKRIIWRGSATHKNDLRVFSDAIVEAAKQLDDFEFVFIGDRPNLKIWNGVKNKKYIETLDIANYYNLLNELEAYLYIFPLEDTKFNRCKSDIGPQEAAYFGTQSLIPEWLETYTNSITYRDHSDFAERLVSACRDNYCYEDFTGKCNVLSDINHDRATLFNLVRNRYSA